MAYMRRAVLFLSALILASPLEGEHIFSKYLPNLELYASAKAYGDAVAESLSRELSRLTYPKRARVRGYEGVTVLSVGVGFGGTLERIEAGEDSWLSRYTFGAVSGLFPLQVSFEVSPSVEAWLSGRVWEYDVRVRYVLSEGVPSAHVR